MKRLAPSDSGPKFRAQIRHYHRTTTGPTEGSWDHWVSGGRTGNSGSRLATAGKIAVVLVVLAALGALIAGFIHIA